ncbi:hypothetical protein K432DRAFT_445373 [Lepidopterella palustris CBS 459.81]|uniref:C2H2-type domain-containing protein n=1 Tax=Lepidopterella palustris CBS 459.81 TaxID=1314670 RepID=A0A8E2JCH2_9PEZI|nr:hypothetical protein K432DRAFT_445373 [Lepidopterella palustris CBS 459.81]
MADNSLLSSSTLFNTNLIPPVKRSLSGGRARPNPRYIARPHLTHTRLPHDPPIASPWSSTPSMVLAVALGMENYHRFFREYQVGEIMKGYELAQDSELFGVLRRFTIEDIMLALKFSNDGALDFFEAFKDFRGSELLQCREAIVGDLGSRKVDGCRDSGYESRPPSEFRDSICSTIPLSESSRSSLGLTNYATSQPQQLDLQSDNGALTLSGSMKQSPFGDSLVDPKIGLQPPQTLFDPPTESSLLSPLDTMRITQARLFECMYCAKDFVRYGDCLNHEENQHSQRKEWICPHCSQPFKSKGGYDRHHRNHGCEKCTLSQRVITLSGPKRACACPYCGKLFEGVCSFGDRSTHVELAHYKGKQRKTRSDLDYTAMIKSLLQQKSLSESWNELIANKRGITLSWSAGNCRTLLEDLEFGNFPKGVQAHVQKVYEQATKSSLPAKASSFLSNHSSSEEFSLVPACFQVNDGIDALEDLSKESRLDYDRKTSQQPVLNDGDLFVIESGTNDNEIVAGSRQVHSFVHSGTNPFEQSGISRPSPKPCSADSKLPVREKPRRSGPFSYASPVPEGDIFMGFQTRSIDTQGFLQDSNRLDGDEIVGDWSETTPAAQSSCFAGLGDPFARMEDLATEHFLSFSQDKLYNNNCSWIPWEDSLPPSLRKLSTRTSLPPNIPLPLPPSSSRSLDIKASTLRHIKDTSTNSLPH